MFICIAGNVDTRAVLKKIEASVKDRGEVVIERGGYDEPQTVNQNYIEQRLPVLTPMFCFGYKQKIESPYRRLKSKVCVELLLEIICGEASPLYKRLMDEGLINDEFDFEYFSIRNIIRSKIPDKQLKHQRSASNDSKINTDKPTYRGYSGLPQQGHNHSEREGS